MASSKAPHARELAAGGADAGNGVRGRLDRHRHVERIGVHERRPVARDGDMALPEDAVAPDFVAVAERFVDVPYLWGGKTSLGIDCSGLVQVALTAAGIACPRDSDMQEKALGTAASDGLSGLRRGDLVFWKGHVAIARDGATLVHANAFHMAVAVEPAAEAVARIAAGGSRVSAIKRLPDRPAPPRS